MNDITQLADTDHGSYFVNTRDSSYLINLDKGWLRRVTREGKELRGDNTQVTLLQVLRCQVGLGATFVLDGLAPVGTTTRRTSPVVSIEVAA